MLLLDFWNYNLTSISTPAGKSNLLNPSVVCWVGSYVSIIRLCVLNSKCSRDFLWTCGERRTQYIRLFVGKGIGPATLASVLFAVSTILSEATSILFCSFAFIQTLILCQFVMLAILIPFLLVCITSLWVEIQSTSTSAAILYHLWNCSSLLFINILVLVNHNTRA